MNSHDKFAAHAAHAYDLARQYADQDVSDTLLQAADALESQTDMGRAIAMIADAAAAEASMRSLTGGVLQPVRVATTQDTEGEYGRPEDGVDHLTSSGIVDGITLREGDGVLVTCQRNPVQNGVYEVVAVLDGHAVMARREDAQGPLPGGVGVYVDEGATRRERLFFLTSNGSVVPGKDPQVWSPFPAGVMTVEPAGGTHALVESHAGNVRVRGLSAGRGVALEEGEDGGIVVSAQLKNARVAAPTKALGSLSVPAPLGAPLPTQVRAEDWGTASELVVTYAFDHVRAPTPFPLPEGVVAGMRLVLINHAGPVRVGKYVGDQTLSLLSLGDGSWAVVGQGPLVSG